MYFYFRLVILWQFGIFSPVLVYCITNNLAALERRRSTINLAHMLTDVWLPPFYVFIGSSYGKRRPASRKRKTRLCLSERVIGEKQQNLRLGGGGGRKSKKNFNFSHFFLDENHLSVSGFKGKENFGPPSAISLIDIRPFVARPPFVLPDKHPNCLINRIADYHQGKYLAKQNFD
jgi:hypothetical protein